jgi:GAF domain-containing protein
VPDDFAEVLAAMARTMRAQPDMQHTLQSAVDLAADHLKGRAEVSVSLVTKGRVQTPASTSERVALADALQYELQEGPCLDAIWEHETFQIEDLAEDEQYPRWSRQVNEQTGFRGVVAYQLFTDPDTLGALNVYTDEPRPYEAVDRAEGLLFATHAALALQAARTEQQLNSALLTRNVIGQAQGILMERYGLSSARAFEFLTRTSQQANVKLAIIAQRLVDSGVGRGD